MCDESVQKKGGIPTLPHFAMTDCQNPILQKTGVCLHSSRGLIAISDGDIDVCPCVYSKAQSQAPSEPFLMLHLTYSFFFSFLLFFLHLRILFFFLYISQHDTELPTETRGTFYFIYWQQRVSLQPYISFSVDQFDHSL